MRRRQFVVAATTATGAVLGGCVFDTDSTDSGTLALSSEDDREHTVTVTVAKTDAEDDAGPGDRSVTPVGTPLWEREQSVEVPAGDTVEEPEFLAEVGTYFVSARTEAGETSQTWFDLYPAGRNGNEVAGGYVQIDIYEDGRLAAYTPVDD